MLARVERQTDVRFGFYLRPSLAMSRAQVEIHNLVARQYGSMTAGKFMPHATIKKTSTGRTRRSRGWSRR
ncbi:MAG: hypothetical protein ACR2GS_08885 [Thermomicrobiales bacterium]